jgi:hypothetical protein
VSAAAGTDVEVSRYPGTLRQDGDYELVEPK